MKRVLSALLTLALLVPLTLAADEPLPILEAGLGKEARSILTQLKEKGYRNVGVLKFLLAREGDNKFTDSLGTLNSLLARRLEIALIVKNFPRPEDTIGIIEDASAVAAKIPGAGHLSKEGISKLFAADYPLAWGKNRVRPDALIIGNGIVAKDLRTITLQLHVLDGKTGKRSQLSQELVFRLRPEHLTETGDSFTRGVFDGGRPMLNLPQPALGKDQVEQNLVKGADAIRKGLQKHPLQDEKNSPFALEVLYNGRIQPIEFTNGEARIPEPEENQVVTIRYKRLDTSDRTFGLVLKVNGENSLFRETLPDLQCRAWLSFAKDDRGEPREIRGFQVSNEKVEKFRVASRAESKAREINYGPDVGTISLTVYQQRTGKAPVRLPNDDAKDELMIRKANLRTQKEKPGTFQTLQQELYADVDRGLITESSEKVDQKIRVVQFERDPVPVMSVTLRYYKAGQ